MREKSHTWKYKDANRVWWRLEVEMEREDCSRSVDTREDDPDHWWIYRLIEEDHEKLFYSGEIWGQYELMPDITYFLADIQNQVNHLCLGMAKYSDK